MNTYKENIIKTKIENGDLYKLLSVCNNAELDVLVKTIISEKPNPLSSNIDYKNHSPNHKRYYQKIGDGICFFGESTYDNVVNNICNILNIPYEKGKIVDNELKLLSKCFGKNVNDLTQVQLEKFIERQQPKELIKDAKDLAGSIIANKLKVAKEGANLIVASSLKDGAESITNTFKDIKNRADLIKANSFKDVKVQAGSIIASTFKDLKNGTDSIIESALSELIRVRMMTDTDFRVTFPCVLYVAFLRKKILDALNGKQSNILDAMESIESNNLAALPQNTPFTEREEAIILVDEASEKPLVTITPIDSFPPHKKVTKIETSESGISQLNPLFQAVPNILIAENVATNFYVQMFHNDGTLASIGECIRRKDGNGVCASIWGITKKGKPGIIENLPIKDTPALSNLVNSAVLFQIASVIVAQKHLADINEKLSSIKHAIDDIKSFQERERKGKVLGAVEYFEQVAPAVFNGEFSSHVRQQIEAQEAKLIDIQKHFVSDIEDAIFKIQKLDEEDHLKDHQNYLYNIFEQLIICLKARACGLKLISAFPEEELIKTKRREDLIKFIDTIMGKWFEMDKTIEKRIKKMEISSLFTAKKTSNQRKLNLLKSNDSFSDRLGQSLDFMKTELDALSSMQHAQLEPVNILVRIDGGKIVEAYCDYD
jgi:hypothetical protein